MVDIANSLRERLTLLGGHSPDHDVCIILAARPFTGTATDPARSVCANEAAYLVYAGRGGLDNNCLEIPDI